MAFSELFVIAIVALIVIGPEKLPKVARAVGLLAGRLQRYMTTVKADISREMQLEDLQKLQQEMKQSVQQVQSELTQTGTELHEGISHEIHEVENSIGGALTQAKKPAILPDEPH